jgi:hypothetical protein
VPTSKEKQKLIEQLTEYTTNWRNTHRSSNTNFEDEEPGIAFVDCLIVNIIALQDSRVKQPILPINAPTPEPDPDWLLVSKFKQHVEAMIANGQIEKEYEVLLLVDN